MTKRSRQLLAVAVCMAWGAGAYANGYKILCVKSAKATAMGEAFIVQADDPSAIAYNPAGLAQVRGEQVSLQATFMNGYTEYTSPWGQNTDIEDRWQTVPSLFATTDLGRDDMALGLGVSFPNGLSSEWSKDSFARYVATYSSLTVADISPAFGMRVGERLMVGAGLDFYCSEARLRNMVDLGLLAGAPGAMDAESKLSGEGTAWGGNVGAIYRITPRHSVAVTYRLPYSVEYDGTYTLAAAGIRSDISATMDFPAAAVMGYAFRPNDTWKFEFNADWTDWQAVDDLTVDFKTPGMPPVTQREDLHNTVACKFGTEYRYSDSLDLRFGYIFNQNATPEATWRPSLPDTDVHFLTAGCGYRRGSVTIDAALQLVFYEKRTIDNNVDLNEWRSSSSIDGTYETFAPCFSLGATYRF